MSPHLTTVCFGWAVHDVIKQPRRCLPEAEKRAEKAERKIKHALGGGVVHIAGALRRAGAAVVPALVTGADPLGTLLMEQARSIWTQARRIATGSQTRISIIEASGRTDGRPETTTTRPALDHAATFQALDGLLAGTRAGRLVIASTRAEDAPLIERILSAFQGEVCLNVTRDQCAGDPLGTLRLARGCRLVGLNAAEMKAWTGFGPPEGLYWLREQGVKSVLCGCGLAGIWAFDGDARPVLARAFHVKTHGGIANATGDEALGVYIRARLDLGVDVAESAELASAAGALRYAGTPFANWSVLQKFAATAPRHPLRPVEVEEPAVQPGMLAQPGKPRWLPHPAVSAAIAALLAFTVPRLLGA